jgi:hypothetical protein
MYPNAMRGLFPLDKGKTINIEKVDNAEELKMGFYSIEFESDMDLPVLPIRWENKLIFPNGKGLKGVYFSEEIELFKKMGGIVTKIH